MTPNDPQLSNTQSLGIDARAAVLVGLSHAHDPLGVILAVGEWAALEADLFNGASEATLAKGIGRLERILGRLGLGIEDLDIQPRQVAEPDRHKILAVAHHAASLAHDAMSRRTLERERKIA